MMGKLLVLGEVGPDIAELGQVVEGHEPNVFLCDEGATGRLRAPDAPGGMVKVPREDLGLLDVRPLFAEPPDVELPASSFVGAHLLLLDFRSESVAVFQMLPVETGVSSFERVFGGQ